ncbi:bacitracin ABC transporter ATP-binding protein [Halalkalibacillus sediminis]|uniref:Bacitracin ABC transporter ATP-binding protein n=1 Tax=Halalkalibacillus sediminis TaxID=2018042 RepID=A0A2I0QY91_9BACI|nr:ABC transporter ATP-binding protein [Halalkalibacillus sediminis]PKR79301.1 bacitracin ABC transporter ATP-binding protein [Halalkalibacillus sediminis]
MQPIAMELKNVRKKIGKKEIINGLDFSIHQGEVFGFIGPNGAGKTTTIRMMVGLMKITEGDIKILGNSIQTDYKKASREVGAIVENPEMYPFMTGMQNLKHYARMNEGVSKERIQEVIKLVGLEKPINEKVKKYSLGMRQRLGIAQALLHKPSVLILDEPTNGLDPSGIREIRKYIRRLAEQENVAVIISSHLLSEIELMCDRIGVIQHGEMVNVQSVHDTEEESGSVVNVQLEVSPVEKAQEILTQQFDLGAEIQEQYLTFKADKKQMPLIIKAFVDSGIDVYQVVASKGTLEDRFFEMMGENVIE